MKPLCLFVDVPMASFRPMWSREYQETYPAPPPSTIYGMLLSLVGVEREQKGDYAGVRLAIALEDQPQIGRIFRKFRRVAQSSRKFRHVAQSGQDDGPLAERRPDYQEIILWLKFWLWIDDAKAKNPLAERICEALDTERRRDVVRHGALCLGESSHMVNEVKLAIGNVAPTKREGRFLVRNKTGFLTMPVWTDHGNDVLHVETFALLEPKPLPPQPGEEEKWITVAPRT